MQTQALLSNIGIHINLDEEEENQVLGLLEEQNFEKGDTLLQQGDFCKNIYFVNSGILRAFHLSSSGKESTIMFAKTDWWITDMYSFLNGLLANVNIQAVEKSNCLKLSKNDLDSLFDDLPKFNVFFRILMQNAYCREQLRTIENLSLPAKDRYDQFVKKYPEIAGSVTQKQIASYLGITPEFLSVIRGSKD